MLDESRPLADGQVAEEWWVGCHTCHAFWPFTTWRKANQFRLDHRAICRGAVLLQGARPDGD